MIVSGGMITVPVPLCQREPTRQGPPSAHVPPPFGSMNHTKDLHASQDENRSLNL